MGNYEQFLGRDIGPEDYMTSGMVYSSVIERERNLGYGGKCGPIQQLYLRNQHKLDVDGDGNMRAPSRTKNVWSWPEAADFERGLRSDGY